MSDVQILKHKDGRPAFAILPYDVYARLCAAAEDAADLAAYREGLADGGEEVPFELTKRIIGGESPVRVWRRYRGLTQLQLAQKVGLAQGDISRLERGRITAKVTTMRAIADTLGVGIDELA